MPDLETLLRTLYFRGDPRISVLESFQRKPYTYVKVVINDGKHDIIVQTITEDYAFPFQDAAMKAAVHSALKKAADIITKSALAPVIKSLGGGSFYSGFWLDP